MSLKPEERRAVVTLETEKAQRTLLQAEAMYEQGFYDGAANRLYYAAFHAVAALFINDGYQVNTHSGSHSMFSLHYVKSGIVSAEEGNLYARLQTLREQSDYNCTYDITAEELRSFLKPTRAFVEHLDAIIQTKQTTQH